MSTENRENYSVNDGTITESGQSACFRGPMQVIGSSELPSRSFDIESSSDIESSVSMSSGDCSLYFSGDSHVINMSLSSSNESGYVSISAYSDDTSHDSEIVHEAGVSSATYPPIFNECYKKVGEKPLGSGAYGVVWLAEVSDQITTQKIAVKSVRNDRVQYRHLLIDEINIHRSVQSEHVIDFLGVDSPFIPVSFFMAFATGGSLYDHVVVNNTELDLDTLLNYGIQLAVGLGYIHSKGVIHGDFKSDNVLIASDGTLKISDFGCAIKESMEQNKLAKYHSRFGGAPKSRAPELLREESFVTKKSDIYSLGWVLWQMASNQEILPGIKESDIKRIKQLVVEENQRANFPQNPARIIPNGYRKMTFFTWHNSPEKRPTTEHILTELVKMQEFNRCGFDVQKSFKN